VIERSISMNPIRSAQAGDAQARADLHQRNTIYDKAMVREIWRHRLKGAALGAAILVSACSVGQVTNADIRVAQSLRPQLATVDDVQNYIFAARHRLENQRDLIQVFETGTNVGTGVGALGAIAGGLLHFSSRFVIRSTLLAGVSLGLNQAYEPKLQVSILDSGIEAIACVEGKAKDTIQALRKYSAVATAIKNLRASIAAALPISDDELRSVILRAQANADSADIYLQSMGDPVASFGDAVAQSVNTILAAVDRQLDDRRPDASAIDNAFKKALPQQPSPSGATPPQLAASSRRQPFTATATEQNATLIEQREKDLSSALAKLTATMPQVTFDVQSCQLNATVLTFYPPDNPIVVTVGRSFQLTVTGNHLAGWEGSPPAEITFTPVGTGIYQLNATAATPDKTSYPLIFTPAIGAPIIKQVTAAKP
jgi:hypothetical protein